MTPLELVADKESRPLATVCNALVVSERWTEQHVDMTHADINALYSPPKGSFMENYNVSDIDRDGNPIIANSGFREGHHSLDRTSILKRRTLRGEVERSEFDKDEITKRGVFLHEDLADLPFPRNILVLFSLENLLTW